MVAAVRLALVWAAAGLVVWTLYTAAWVVGGAALVVYAIECALWHNAERTNAITFPHIVVFMVSIDPLNYALDMAGSGHQMVAEVVHVAMVLFRAGAIGTVVLTIRMYPTYVAAWSCYKHAPIAEYDKGTCPKLHLGQGDNMPDWVCTDDAYKYDNGCLLEPENASWGGYPAVVHYLLLALAVDLAAYVLLALIRSTPQV